MASTTSVSEENKETMNKMLVELEEANASKILDQLIISLKNKGAGEVVLRDTHGSSLDHAPAKIPNNDQAYLGQETIVHGGKAAVVYYGPNYCGEPNVCAWLLAWSVTGDGSLNKIYADAAPIDKYPVGSIDWATVIENLDKSSHESDHWDVQTGARVSAKINYSDKYPRAAPIFDVTPV